MGLFKSFRSWRMDRFRKKDGWRRLITRWDIWMVVIGVGVSVWCMQSLQPTGFGFVDTSFDVLTVFSIIGVLFALMHIVLSADDYCKIVTREHGHKVFSSAIYLYRRKHGTYKMTIINHQRRNSYFGTSKIKFLIKDYDVLKFAREKFFLFTLTDDENCWYSLCNNVAGEQKLGQRIGKIVFIKDDHCFNKKIVSVLNDTEFTVYHVDECFFDNVNVVDKTGVRAIFANQYIVLGKDGQYTVLGLYFSDKKALPHVAEEDNLSFSILTTPHKE